MYLHGNVPRRSCQRPLVGDERRKDGAFFALFLGVYWVAMPQALHAAWAYSHGILDSSARAAQAALQTNIHTTVSRMAPNANTR